MRGRGELYHWNDDTNAWQHVGQFASQTSNAVVYPDGMFIDDIGDVHLVFCLRAPEQLGHRRRDSCEHQRGSGCKARPLLSACALTSRRRAAG